MSGFDMSKYREMFAEEASEIFDDVDNLLLEAESSGSLDDEQMNVLFRGVHTLKGSGASVELTKFAGFAHHAENLMDELRNHRIEYHESMAPFLIDCMDTLKVMLTLETNGDLDDDMYQTLIDTKLDDIKVFLSGKLLDDDSENVEEPIVEVVQEEKTISKDTSIDTSDDDSFGLFDDEPISQNIDKEQEDEAFEYFNRSITPAENLHDGSNSASIGFFDDDLNASVSSDNSDFGFFDESFISYAKTADSKSIENNKQVKIDSEPKPIIKNNTSEFGMFDDHNQKEKVIKPIEKLKVEKKATIQKVAVVDKKLAKSSNNIRVNLDKIDTLMNGVGDLVITNAMLTQYANSIEDKKIQAEIIEKLDHLNRHIRAMQDSIMSIRMVPMESVYSKFPKIIRDLSKSMDKKVNFTHTGDTVEIDKAMIEGLTDPLVHIIRNSLDHGLESPQDRLALGKNEVGSISISAEQSNGQMIISIMDDGAGINLDKVVAKAIENGTLDENQAKLMNDNDKAMLIFGAGLSTAKEVTSVSGRGVGMDVVKTNITKLGGIIKIDTDVGVGTTITIVLPLTLAILDGLDIAIGETTYILPLNSIVESIQPSAEMIKKVGDGAEELLMLREEFIPIVRLSTLLNIDTSIDELTKGMLIVVKAGNEKVAIFVDKFLEQQQVVVKPIDKNFKQVPGIGAATVRGDGSIGLILDVLGIIDFKKDTYRDNN
jgi:two-component system chemotaxis sensor kinase CheA